MDKKNKAFLPVLFVFIALNGFFLLAKHPLEHWHADQTVLIAGNLLLFLVTTASFVLAQRGLKNPNPHAFVRSVYGSVMIKLFVCMIAAFIYVAAFKSSLNKPALFTCMGLYLVYTFMEVGALMKMLKEKKNA